MTRWSSGWTNHTDWLSGVSACAVALYWEHVGYRTRQHVTTVTYSRSGPWWQAIIRIETKEMESSYKVGTCIGYGAFSKVFNTWTMHGQMGTSLVDVGYYIKYSYHMSRRVSLYTFLLLMSAEGLR
ncbi:MAG: hypothetical protein EXQ71_02215 [Acidimicrobiia bacterium]|nr:hypothetical protein [Acidimicrobiia bacterium]